VGKGILVNGYKFDSKHNDLPNDDSYSYISNSAICKQKEILTERDQLWWDLLQSLDALRDEVGYSRRS
jgi:hypothetical protein